MKTKNSNDICGVYSITNIVNGKIYVGQSIHVMKEWNSAHKPALRYNRHHNRHLQRAWNLYGESNFTHSLVEECNIDSLNKLEEFYIIKFKSHCSLGGYNISWGGESVMKNRKHSLDSRKKMSLSKQTISDATRLRMKESKIGVKKRKSSSKYYGVFRRVVNKGLNVYWRAIIKINNKSIHIGNFKEEEDAAKAYDSYILAEKLPYPLNFQIL